MTLKKNLGKMLRTVAQDNSCKDFQLDIWVVVVVANEDACSTKRK